MILGMSTVSLSPDRLRSAREAAGLSQVEAAEAVGVARASIQNAEAGRFTPRADALARMAELYGITIDSLFVHEDCVAAGVGASLHDGTSTTNGDSRGRQEAKNTETVPPATRQNRGETAQ